jgi:hypothetical protein
MERWMDSVLSQRVDRAYFKLCTQRQNLDRRIRQVRLRCSRPISIACRTRGRAAALTARTPPTGRRSSGWG